MISRSPARVFVFLCLVVFLFSSAVSGQDALQLFHKMQTALGGAEKIGAIRDFEESVRADAWYGDGRTLGEVHKRTRWIRPNYLRLDQVAPGDTYVLFRRQVGLGNIARQNRSEPPRWGIEVRSKLSPRIRFKFLAG